MSIAPASSRPNLHIVTWRDFAQIRASGSKLLKRLDDFPNSVLVTGCQRSGTTMLSRIITQSDGMVNYWFGQDDELDAALILSGWVDHDPQGRYCFQTTYVNKEYLEYCEHSNEHKVIWVLRNPYSVIYSMLNNWANSAVDRLFISCGISFLHGRDWLRYRLGGISSISRIRRACYAYNGKVSTLFELKRQLSAHQLMIVDYDHLVLKKELVLPAIYAFIDLPYREDYSSYINVNSLDKSRKLPPQERRVIQRICEPIYQQALKAVTPVS